jgi:hypothetical protein
VSVLAAVPVIFARVAIFTLGFDRPTGVRFEPLLVVSRQVWSPFASPEDAFEHGNE